MVVGLFARGVVLGSLLLMVLPLLLAEKFCTAAVSAGDWPPLAAQPDPEGITSLIETVAPVLYLHTKERAYPITFEEYLLHPETHIVETETGKVIVAKGAIRFEQLDALARGFWKEGKAGPRKSWHCEISPCLFAGADPQDWRDSKGNLTTPIYVLAIPGSSPQQLFLQFLFFYGYNAPYEITVAGIPLFTGDQFEFQNAHEADLEHITMEVDTERRTVKRLFYGAHGSREGMWLTHPEIEFEEGTHPVVYVARGGHGNYPRAGTWVRILGFANDITEKGIRWVPELRRIFAPFTLGKRPEAGGSKPHEQYDPQRMGWLALSAKLGRRGVNAPWNQWWFGNPKENARTFAEGLALYCKSGDSECIRRKAPEAAIPGGNPYELDLVKAVWKAGLKIESGIRGTLTTAQQELLKASRSAKDELTRAAARARTTSERIVSDVKRSTKSATQEIKKAAHAAYNKLLDIFS